MPVTLTFDWVPNPLVIAEGFDEAALELENMIPPLEASARVAAFDAAQRFDEEGPGWAPWALGEQVPLGHGTIGDLTGAMSERAGDPGEYHLEGGVGGGSIEYTLQEGKEASFQFGRAGEIRHTHKGDAYTGGAQPPRPFIGLSPSGENMVEAIFAAWLDEILAGAGWGGLPTGGLPFGVSFAFFSKTGKPVYRGAGGKFVSGEGF